MRPRLPSVVLVLGWTSLLNDAASEMIYPLLPLYLTGVLGVGAATIGVIEGAADATASLLKLVSGQLSDRRRRRKPFVLLGYLIAALARPAVALARGPISVLAVRISDRFGKGLRASPRDALIADVTPPALHGRAFGVHEAMDHAGAVIGPLVAYALLTGGMSLRTIFALAILPGLGSVALVALLVRDAPPLPAGVVRLRAAPETTSGDGPAPALPDEPFAPSRAFVGYLAAVTIFTLGNSSDAFLLLRAHDAGLPRAAAPLLWSLHHTVKAVCSFWGGGLADRIGHRRALALGFGVYAAIYCGFAFATSAAAITGLFVAYGLYFGLVGGAQKALVAALVPAHYRARGYGLYHLFVGLAAFPASVIFGVLYQEHGARAAFGTGAGLAALAALLLPLSSSKEGPGRAL